MYYSIIHVLYVTLCCSRFCRKQLTDDWVTANLLLWSIDFTFHSGCDIISRWNLIGSLHDRVIHVYGWITVNRVFTYTLEGRIEMYRSWMTVKRVFTWYVGGQDWLILLLLALQNKCSYQRTIHTLFINIILYFWCQQIMWELKIENKYTCNNYLANKTAPTSGSK